MTKQLLDAIIEFELVIYNQEQLVDPTKKRLE